MGMDCRVYAAPGEAWLGVAGGGASGGRVGGLRRMADGFSYDSENDLAAMVRDFVESGGGAETDSVCSTDSDSSFCDLAHLADKISHFKSGIDRYQSDLLSVVNSLMPCINELDLHIIKSCSCNGSCIRYSLVKLLRLSGYDAGVCVSKWAGHGKVPGGEHEYIDVIDYSSHGNSERVIIDVNFRSHFEIARAVESYNQLLDSLPVVYVGSFTKLKQFLQVMAEAAKSSLKQNSMPFPPWRSLAYLQSKWQSPYQRKLVPDGNGRTFTAHDRKCVPLLQKLQSTLGGERALRPVNSDRPRLNLGRKMVVFC
ncbi:hypothetical protein DM860_003906 [Cuscuta australis]|uniref:Plant-specific domain TIGR01615 family protein n=1 Tax=Cuscuta australis TaxID=267555 RepID=A0A328CV96_9ASTE|nr:hypothetical protein DM860_003906 [Cuscuta australis]